MNAARVSCSVSGGRVQRVAAWQATPSARAGQGPLSFGQLHAVSAAFFVVKGLLVLLLAWRSADALRPRAS